MEEIWKDIEGYDGLYQISNFGRSRSFKWNKIRYLKANISSSGYYRNNLGYIHTLVWDHFGNSKRNSKLLQVDHIDGNKLNNRIDNLQLLSSRENITKHHLTKNKTSKYIGVWWIKQNRKWAARIQLKNKKIYLGSSFNTEYEAHLAYEKALDKIKNNNN